VTHHLFSRLPRHNLRRASELVKEFALDQGLTYAEFGFVAGNQQVIGMLRHVAEQGKVANFEVKEAMEKRNDSAMSRVRAANGNGIHLKEH
jgi:delta8-fatty-acid desaturase